MSICGSGPGHLFTRFSPVFTLIQVGQRRVFMGTRGTKLMKMDGFPRPAKGKSALFSRYNAPTLKFRPWSLRDTQYSFVQFSSSANDALARSGWGWYWHFWGVRTVLVNLKEGGFYCWGFVGEGSKNTSVWKYT